jgi:hypothetical protein
MEFIIDIDDQYRVELDRYSWQISRWRKPTKTKPDGHWEGEHWYPRMGQVVAKLLELKVIEQDHAIVTMPEAITRARDEIMAAVKAAKIPDVGLLVRLGEKEVKAGRQRLRDHQGKHVYGNPR